jgi:hypothetical protein
MSWHCCHMRGDGAQALLENGAVHVLVYNLLAIVRKGCRSWSCSSPLLLHPIQSMRAVTQGPWEVRRKWRRRREGNPSMAKGRVVQMQVAACMMSFGVFLILPFYFCSILRVPSSTWILLGGVLSIKDFSLLWMRLCSLHTRFLLT